MGWRREALLAAVLLLLTAALAITYLRPRGTRAAVAISELPRTFTEVASGVNLSTFNLLRSLRSGAPGSPENRARLEQLAQLLANLTESGEWQLSELGLQLRASSGNYSLLASAGADMELAADAMSGLHPALESFLEGLARCNGTQAELAARALLPSIPKARGELQDALGKLALVDEESLPLESHRRVFESAVGNATRALKALAELEKAARLVSALGGSYLEARCRGEGAGLPSQDAVALARSIDPKAYPEASYELALLKSLVLQGEGSSGGSGTGGAGSGAGWGSPPGDD
ncbi:hypothetical protein [Infirmifilum sp. SLHALR2]|nr:MAG: hypothetical protein B7L53_06640 [Thermofilum sp. NZ13]